MKPGAHRQIKLRRPGWWTQEGVLARLHAGEFVMAVCQAATDEMAEIGVEVAPTTLRADIAKWAETVSWGEQFRAALALWKRTGTGEMVLSKAWHEPFLVAMETEECAGNAQKAAQAAGVGYGVVLAVLDRRNKCYDADFAEKFRLAEMERVGVVRERYWELAEKGEGKLAAMAQKDVIEAALPDLHGRPSRVQVTGRIKHDHEHAHQHEHLHGLAPGLAREVVLASQQRVRRIEAGRNASDGLLPADTRDEDRVIDLTPQSVEVR